MNKPFIIAFTLWLLTPIGGNLPWKQKSMLHVALSPYGAALGSLFPRDKKL